MSEKRGVEIDYCPECRGIWLDRGELEKLIEKEEKTYNTSSKDDYYDEDDHNHKKTNKRRKKESLLSEVFEIFGD